MHGQRQGPLRPCSPHDNILNATDRHLIRANELRCDIVRGANREWAKNVYGFALKPDVVYYLRADIPTLVSRMVYGRGFNYWESGMDIRCADNLYDSFCVYQGRVIQEFDLMAEEYGFETIDANRPVNAVFEELKTRIRPLLETA